MDPLNYRPPAADQLADLPIFRQPAVPSVPVDTPEDAAGAIQESGRATKLRLLILRLIAGRVASGMTADEIQVATGLDGNTVRSRLVELHDRQLIEASQRVKRPTRRGKLARAVYATPKARRVLRGEIPMPPVVRRRKEDAA